MNELISYLVKNITGTQDFTITEEEMENGINYTVLLPQEFIGLVIGKGGQTIKALRNIIKVKATLDKTLVNLTVAES
jgi:predicted RNA-binding protein YlqC (UPF0109 family)